MLALDSSPCVPPMPTDDDKVFGALVEHYTQARYALYPFEATQNGVAGFNHLFPAEFTDGYRQKAQTFYEQYLAQMASINPQKLTGENYWSHKVLLHQISMERESLKFPDNLMPINQFNATTLYFAQLGSGGGDQPFRTRQDYLDWHQRLQLFPAYVDSCIAYMQRGIRLGTVLPRSLVVKMLPQYEAFGAPGGCKIFYQPLDSLALKVSAKEQTDMANLYKKAIETQVAPAYRRLHQFLKTAYLPAARSTDGLGAIPQGAEYYRYLVRYYTTTDLAPQVIHKIGLAAVDSIEKEFERVKAKTNFNGNLRAFYHFLQTDAQFYPFKDEVEVLEAYRKLQAKAERDLSRLFWKMPQCRLEILPMEPEKRASGSHEYRAGTTDCSRPGRFMVPIPDATRYWRVEMDALFAHEAYPGHHHQIMSAIENLDLPEFRRNLSVTAYLEGWGLYSESQWQYDDPYSYCGKLAKAQHRMIRLVVDTGIHYYGWTRQQAIDYFKAHSPRPEQDIVMEVERYMAYPGQALSYYIGARKITELRERARKNQRLRHPRLPPTGDSGGADAAHDFGGANG